MEIEGNSSDGYDTDQLEQIQDNHELLERIKLKAIKIAKGGLNSKISVKFCDILEENLSFIDLDSSVCETIFEIIHRMNQNFEIEENEINQNDHEIENDQHEDRIDEEEHTNNQNHNDDDYDGGNPGPIDDQVPQTKDQHMEQTETFHFSTIKSEPID